ATLSLLKSRELNTTRTVNIFRLSASEINREISDWAESTCRATSEISMPESRPSIKFTPPEVIWFQPRANSPPKLGGVAARINVSQNCARRRGGSKRREATLFVGALREYL